MSQPLPFTHSVLSLFAKGSSSIRVAAPSPQQKLELKYLNKRFRYELRTFFKRTWIKSLQIQNTRDRLWALRRSERAAPHPGLARCLQHIWCACEETRRSQRVAWLTRLASSTTLTNDITRLGTWDVPRHKQTLKLHELGTPGQK